jgi:hypothetical protein
MTKKESVDAASLHPIVPRPLSDEVADKAKRVFQLMESQDGTKAFGSVMGTDILITIERVKTDRPAWWPVDWEWPPTLSDAEALRAVAEGVPCTPEDVAAEELRQQREGTFELPESLRDASKVLDRIKATEMSDDELIQRAIDGEVRGNGRKQIEALLRRVGELSRIS